MTQTTPTPPISEGLVGELETYAWRPMWGAIRRSVDALRAEGAQLSLRETDGRVYRRFTIEGDLTAVRTIESWLRIHNKHAGGF